VDQNALEAAVYVAFVRQMMATDGETIAVTRPQLRGFIAVAIANGVPDAEVTSLLTDAQRTRISALIAELGAAPSESDGGNA
jgi:hypothetical protein